MNLLELLNLLELRELLELVELLDLLELLGFAEVAGFAGADYSFTHGETFVIWILMAILVNNCFNK